MYDIDLVSLDKIKNIDAVILAVAHDSYRSISKESWKDIFNDEGVFIDVKSIFQKDYFNNLLIHHWRL